MTSATWWKQRKHPNRTASIIHNQKTKKQTAAGDEMRRRAKLEGTKTKSATHNRVKGQRVCSVNTPLVIYQAVRLKRTAIYHRQNWIQGCGESMWVIVPNGEQLNRFRPPTIQHEGDQSHVEIITLSNHELVHTNAVPPPCPQNTVRRTWLPFMWALIHSGAWRSWSPRLNAITSLTQSYDTWLLC